MEENPIRIPLFDAESMERMQRSIRRFNKSLMKMGLRIRERRLNRQGISTGLAPGPFGEHIDISIPHKTPRL